MIPLKPMMLGLWTRSRRSFYRVAVAAAVCLLLSAAGAQATAGQQATAGAPPAPSQCLLAGRIADPADLLQRLARPLRAADGRTEAADLAQALAARMGLPDATCLDLSQPVEFFYLTPAKHADPWVFRFRTTDAARLREALAGSHALVCERGTLVTATRNPDAAPGELWAAVERSALSAPRRGQLSVHADVQGLLQVFDAERRLLRVYHNQPDSSFQTYAGGPPPSRRLPNRPGINRFHWDMRRAAIPGIPGVYVHGSYQGSLVGPGEYILRLSSPYDTVEQRCRLLPDPRLPAAPEAYARQQEALEQLDHAIRDLHLSVNRMREVKKQIAFVNEQLKKAGCDDKIIRQGSAVQDRIERWEQPLIQTRQQTGQDVINFPNRLNSEVLTLIERIDSPDPRLTEGARRRMEDLLQEWSIHKAAMREIMDKDIARFNRLFKEQDLPVVLVPSSAD